MADFKQAVQWMKEGRRVRHSDWNDSSCVSYCKDRGDFRNSRDLGFDFGLNDFECEWELYKEGEKEPKKDSKKITDDDGITYEEVSYQKYLTSKNKHRIVKSLESQYFVEVNDVLLGDKE